MDTRRPPRLAARRALSRLPTGPAPLTRALGRAVPRFATDRVLPRLALDPGLLPRLAGLSLFGALGLWAASETRRLRQVPQLPSVAADLDRLIEVGQDDGQSPLTIVTVGDSLVAGVGAGHVDHSLPVQLARRVAEQLGRPVRVRNLGVSGARAADVRNVQVQLLATGPPADVIVFSVGANDTTHLTPLSRFREDLLHAVRVCRAEHDAAVVLTGVPDFRSLRLLSAPLREAAARYGEFVHRCQRDLAAGIDGVWFADVLSKVGAEFRADEALVCEDRFHPSAAGIACLAEAATTEVVAAARWALERREGAGTPGGDTLSVS